MRAEQVYWARVEKMLKKRECFSVSSAATRGHRDGIFAGTIFLVLAGIWALGRIPLDALPDISDVEVTIHVPWAGQPPNLIEDQVTYPIVTSLLAAPHVRALRAQTMFGDSYVFVVFEDGTDLYWARSRVFGYMQQIQGRLPETVHPVIGPDATGVGWVYEYALVDHSHKRSLADLRSIQDWYLRYQLETVHIHDSRANTCSRIFCPDEGTRSAAWHLTGKRPARKLTVSLSWGRLRVV